MLPSQGLFTLTELLASISASTVFISEGMHRGWSAPAIPKLQSKNSTITITNTDIMGLESIYFVGELVSIPLAVYLIDRIGRKKSILINTAVGMIAWLILAVANQIRFLYVARFLAGATGNISMTSVPIYISETTNPKVRSVFLGIVSFIQTFGILVIYSLIPFVPFYVPSIVAEVVLTFQLITFSFMPESPYYLILKGEENLARKSLRKLRGSSYHDNEINQIIEAVGKHDDKESQFQKLKTLFSEKSNKKALIIATFLYSGLQFGGFSVVLMNVDDIFSKTKSMYLDSSIAEIIFAVLMLMGNFVCLLCVKRFGKKKMLLVSSTSATICLTCLAVYFHLMSAEINVMTVGWVATVSVTAYAVCFYVGFGSLTEPMAAELFSTDVRATGTTFTNAIDASFGMLSILLYNLLVDKLGICVAYYFFAGVNLLSSFFILLVLPETNGKSLQEIHNEFEHDTNKVT